MSHVSMKKDGLSWFKSLKFEESFKGLCTVLLGHYPAKHEVSIMCACILTGCDRTP